ncbi:T9SS type A sorting domain-containing protein [Winogradskyella forsetii]|uniref:T9SS type A sorting domain-containing protein n=1 Tax=Winogradskyella forsetii TaxID=2686077 RepID=UPI0015BD3CCC|nr:T9SS type A sorting domain-containing protein [Winogradskyella forsetii]
MKKITFLFLTLMISSFTWAQCGPGGGQFPSSVITVDADGDLTGISTCNYTTEFSAVDGIVAGNEYEVSITLAGVDLYVTVENAADDSVIDHGASPFTFIAPAGVTGLHLNWSEDASCTYVGSGCRVTTIQDLTAAADACPAPEDFEVSNIMDTTADLSWTDSGVVTVDFNVEVYLAGESAADANTPVFSNANVVGTTVSITGLSESTDYDAYITANCSGATTTSELVGAESFTTTASCSDVTDLDVENVASTSVDVTFTPGTGNDSFLVEVYLDGESAADSDTPVYSNASATGSPENVTGLSITTDYDVYVTGFCDATATALVGPESFTTLTTPPTNDECADAIALTVNAGYECGTVTPGTTLGATASSEDDAGTSGTPNNDVWFSFVATSTDHRVSLLNVTDVPDQAPTSTDMGMAVYDATGGCAGLVFVDTSDPNTLNLTDLTVATTYYVRVYGWSSSIAFTAQATFDICIGTQPTNTVDFCNLQFPNSGAISEGDNFEAYAQVFEAGVTEPAGQVDNIEAWIGYNTTDATTTADFETGWTWVVADYNSDNGNNDEYFAEIGSGLDPDTYYYVSRFSIEDGPFTYGGINPGSSDGNFWDGTNYVSGELVVSPPPVPDNDLFADAIVIDCGSIITGTTLGATQDEADAPDDTTVETNTAADNDSPWVWYSFTGTGASEIVTLSTCGTANTNFDTEIFVYTGTSGSLTLIDDGYDECGGASENYAAETSFTSDGTTTYYVAIGGYQVDDVGNFQLTVSCETVCTADAGTITADATPVELTGGTATISATPNGDIVVPTDYDVTYVLTSGADLVIEQAGATPSFDVTAAGDYTIHTLVAETTDNTDPNYLDLSVIVFGTTTGGDVLDIVSANDLCASLDVTGAPIVVLEECLADAGTLTADATPVSLVGGTATISATPNGDIVVPTDYDVTYVLTSGASLVIEQAGATPSFDVTTTGDYTIHTLVAETTDNTDPNYLDLSVIVFGTTTGGDVLTLVGDNDLCASLDVTGAPITVDDNLSIDDVNEALFTYHPNPVKNALTLNAQNTIEQVAVYNMLGQEVLTAMPNSVDSDLDMSNLQTGTYFVKVTISNVTKTIRVIKQ